MIKLTNAFSRVRKGQGCGPSCSLILALFNICSIVLASIAIFYYVPFQCYALVNDNVGGMSMYNNESPSIHDNFEERVLVLHRSVLQEAELIYNNMTTHNEAQYLTNAALAFLLGTSMQQSRSKVFVDKAVTIFQYMLKNHIAFGTSFGGSFVGTALRRFYDELPTETMRMLVEALYAELPTEPHQANHNDVSYNNMYLMEAINLIVIGETLHALILDKGFIGVAEMGSSSISPSSLLDPNRALNAASSGYSQLQEWFDYAHAHGIHEFTSPTYTWVQLEAMTNGYMWMEDNEMRRKLQASLDHIWAQLAANFFQGDRTLTLSGPHSRDYDTLFGQGGVRTNLFIQGLIDVPYTCERHDLHCESMGPNRIDTGSVYVPGSNLVGLALQNVMILSNALAVIQSWGNGYTPNSKALSLAHEWQRRGDYGSEGLYRIVQSTFGNSSSSSRYNFVTKEFAIGTTSEDYVTDTHFFFLPCPQSKPVTVMVASDWSLSEPIPNLAIVPHWEEVDVYGREERPVHLPLHQLAVQHGGEALVMMLLNGELDDLDGFSVPDNATVLSTNFILPRPKSAHGRYGGGVAYASFSPSAMSTVSEDRTQGLHKTTLLQNELETNQTEGSRNTEIKMLPHNVLLSNQSWRIETGKAIAVRIGLAAVVVRVIDASACQHCQLQLNLRGDDGDKGGLQYGAIRFEVRHFQSSSERNETIVDACSNSPIRVAFMVAAYTLETLPSPMQRDVELLEITEKAVRAESSSNVRTTGNNFGNNTIWDVKIQTPQGILLEGSRLLSANPLESVGRGVLYRRINGQNVKEPTPAFVSVNGFESFPIIQ